MIVRDSARIVLPPWEENAYHLTSWWEMQQFCAKGLTDAVTIIERVQFEWANARPRGDVAFTSGPVLLSNEQREELANKAIIVVETALGNSGLPTSAEVVWELRVGLLSWDNPVFARFTAENVVTKCAEILQTMRREMRTTLFMYFTREEAKRFEIPLDKWEEVTKRWSSTAIDVAESGKCFACSRYAAAIFHILLVAEFGVIQVAKLIDVGGDKPGWASLERIQQLLDKDFQDRPPKVQQHSALLAQLMPLLLSMKNSWRHKISHVDNRLMWLDTDFSEEIAEEVITATRGFMRRLATELPV
jgi:hypothetical protein